MAGPFSFVCLNNDGFDGLRRPRHILAERLNRLGYSVLFVSSPVDYISQRFQRQRLRWGGLARIAKDFRWYQPPCLLPNRRGSWSAPAMAMIRDILLETAVRLFAGTNPVFFVTVPDADYIRLVRKFPNALVIYNVHDRFADAQGAWVDGHDELLALSDIVLCGSQSLADEMRGRCDKPVRLLPPGVDFQIFPRVLPYPGERRGDGPPVIGCIGNFGTQIDWPLLADLAAAAPGYLFRLVGPVTRDARAHPAFAAFAAQPNVQFIDPIDHRAVPDMIAGFDVCMMPYVISLYTDGINPLKLYEYLAMGRPVVSSPITAAKPYAGPVLIAAGLDGWLTALDQALAPADQAAFEARRAIALAQDYGHRVGMLLELAGKTRRVAERRFSAGKRNEL